MLKHVLIGLVLATALGCAGEEDISLSDEIPCNDNNPCPEGASCLIDICVQDGTLIEGDTCNDQAQCSEGFICSEFICKQGCADVYYQDVCADDQWCAPIPGATIIVDDEELPAGECSASECDPSVVDMCEDGIACVAVSSNVGACLPYCQYGFSGGDYFDTCLDVDGEDLACQVLGISAVPVCLPVGDLNAPIVGLPGCDAIRNPCAADAVCINVVCRQLCTAAQLDPCGTGQTCAPVGTRTDVSFCVAE